MVADHVTFGARSALRETAVALGYPPAEVDRFAWLWIAGQPDQIPREVLSAAAAITGLPRHLGLHPGGVVIVPEDIHCHTHVQTSLAGWPVIAWEKDAAEDAGLVKIDLLGNRSLAVLRDCLAMVNPGRTVPVVWGSHDSLSDPRTRSLVEAGQTLGVFYVESPATRQLLRKMGRADYEHLVVASSIIRPAANRYIAEYVRRLHGGDWRSLHPLVADVLEDTLGIMVYQEDVSRVAIAAAGFSAGEADALRKVLSRKDREARLAAFRQRFCEGAAGRGVGADTIQALWDMILSFDGYSFCKSHSASYALVSYQLAWMRAWHPLEFYTAVINNGGGFYARQVYLNEVRRLGFPIAGPDVNASAMAGRVREGGLRLGLCQITGLSTGFVQTLVSEREKGGSFRDLEDFVGRMAPGPGELRLLIRGGALDSLAGALTRPQIFWIYAGFRSAGRRHAGQPARRWPGGTRPRPGGRPEPGGAADVAVEAAPLRGAGARQGGLFPASLAVPECIGDYRPETKLADEMEFLGLLYTRHPLEVFLPRVAAVARRQALGCLVDSRGLAGQVGRRVSIPGTLVAEKEVRTRKAEAMSFVSFEDPWGIFETVLFPDAFERLSVRLLSAYAFIVQGVVQEDNGALTVEVDDLIVLNRER
jgi:error-prone DNA polymerase